jgi:hypothetical protein
MESKSSGISGRAVVILGAGATRGEHRLPDAPGGSRPSPPLDRDFFNELQKVAGKDPDDIRVLLRRARELFGPGPDCSMEEFFTTVEFLERFAELADVEGHWVNELRWKVAMTAFRWGVVRLLDEAGIGGTSPGQPPHYHGHLARILEGDDVIVTFNYDTLIDRALRDAHRGAWSPGALAGINVKGDVQPWGVSAGGEKPVVHLLKMHGSVNWEIKGDELWLSSGPVDPDDVAIIPPAWEKGIEESDVFSSIWKAAFHSLVSAAVLVVVGYALPATDMWTRALLRSAAAHRREKEESFEYVLLADPESRAYATLVSVLGPAIGNETRVMRFEDFAHLTEFLGH